MLTSRKRKKEPSTENYFVNLPNEILALITSFLMLKQELVNLSQVDKRFNAIVNQTKIEIELKVSKDGLSITKKVKIQSYKELLKKLKQIDSQMNTHNSTIKVLDKKFDRCSAGFIGTFSLGLLTLIAGCIAGAVLDSPKTAISMCGAGLLTMFSSTSCIDLATKNSNEKQKLIAQNEGLKQKKLEILRIH